MALKSCRECAAQVAGDAAVCPNCGTSYPARKIRHPLATVALVVIIIALGVPVLLSLL